MNWIRVLSEQELPEGERKVVEVEGRLILLIHREGEVYATSSNCPHMGGPLVKGSISPDGAIICPWHHSAFDIRTGDVKEWSPRPPGVGKVLGIISRKKALTVYPTRVEGGSIWVGLEGG
ncbi:MAG: Rieske (2Fe-2S) protein [Methanophagales archaeon ANME-1-THS]|nr:MAG: Rieske (2Fe-2S) protein [Methanophagales archaeon ANME-1-THS]